jgi:hypothetical protein
MQASFSSPLSPVEQMDPDLELLSRESLTTRVVEEIS